MRKLILTLIAAVPLAALAAPKAAGPGGGPPGDETARMERMERRMRLARTLGLAEALDLNESQALKMQEAMSKFDERRKPLLRQMHDSMMTLRRAATGDETAQGQVDQAMARIFDARAQIQQVDREMFGTITKDLSPQKRARAAVFLSHFRGRFGRGPGMGAGWHGGRGMMRGPGPGGGPGEGGRGTLGPGMGGMGPMGMGPGPGGDCPCTEGEDCPEECAMNP